MRSLTLRRWASVFAVVVVAGSADVAFAQGGRGGPGNFGGFGGGPGGFGGGNDPYSLLSNEAVREELDVVPEQEDKIRAVREEAAEELRTELAAVQKKISEKYAAKYDEILLPSQVERLRGIRIQLGGSSALEDADVAEALGLTAEQKDQIKSIRAEQREAMRNFRPGEGGFDREAFARQREENESKILGVLTSEQTAKFNEMKGDPIDAAAFRGGRGGPGGFGGRGGEQGRGGEGRGRGRGENNDN